MDEFTHSLLKDFSTLMTSQRETLPDIESFVNTHELTGRR
jgi:hypothetical protein